MNNGYFQMPGILMATITLSLTALFAMLLLKQFPCASAKTHRFIWLAVLLNGIIVWRFPVELPVLEAPSNTSLTQTEHWQNTELAHSAARVSTTAGPLSTANLEPTLSESPNSSAAILSPASDGSSKNVASLSASAIATLVWFSGMIVTMLILANRYLRVYQSLKSSRPPGHSYQNELDQIASQHGIQDIPLRFHDSLGPMLLATPLRNQIVVPHEFWVQLTRTQRDAILNHELAHLMRRDIWKSLFATCLAVFQWFNPLAWLALNHFNQAAEWACDEQVGEQNSQARIGFARALLSLSTGNRGYLVGASNAASNNLSSRVKRLLSDQSSESKIQKVLLAFVIGMIATLGWFNLRLVAAPHTVRPVTQFAVQDEEGQEYIDQLIQQVAGNDELSKKLITSMKTPAGVVAVKNRVGTVRDQMRQQASKTIIADFFASSVNSDFLAKLEREIQLAKSDIANIDTALTELKTQMQGKSESDLLLQRFLGNSNAAVVLYFSQFRREMRPGKSRVMEKLGQFIAEDDDGRYIIRESAKDEFIAQVKRFDGFEKHVAMMQKELKNWSNDIVAKDKLHQRVKDGLARPNAAAVALSRMERKGSARERVEQYFEFLEKILVDSAEGLVIPEEFQEQVKAAIASADQHREKIELLRAPIAEIVAAINERGEAERLAKHLLSSEFGLSLVVDDIDVGMSSPDAIIGRIKSEALQQMDSGGFEVREDRQEAVTKFARDMLKNSRQARRHTMILDEQIEQIKDQRLREMCDQFEGRMVLIDKIQARAQAMKFKAWERWIELVFEKTDDGLAVRPEMQPEVDRILQDAATIDQEMQKDDF